MLPGPFLIRLSRADGGAARRPLGAVFMLRAA
jgi:hypothetical protein